MEWVKAFLRRLLWRQEPDATARIIDFRYLEPRLGNAP